MEKHVFNPPMRLALRLGLAPRHFVLLETKGRKSGRVRLSPLGGAMLGQAFWVVAEHGTGCGYVKNLTVEPAVRVKIRRMWHSGRATVVRDDDPMARHRQVIEANGWVGRADGIFFRAAATSPVSVRIDLD